jgi:hypothetical protein
MKKIILLAATLMIAGSSPSWAWGVVSGGVIAIDRDHNQFTLDNRKTYTAEAGISLDGIKVGTKVQLVTQDQEGEHMITKLSKLG